MARRKSRVAAFQGLYSWDMSGMDVSEILKLNWMDKDDNFTLTEEESAFSRILIAGTIENCEHIDELIKGHLKNWEFKRVNKVSLAILRMSVYSLLFMKEIHSSVIINEAVDIAKNYGPKDSYRFINAVLDTIRKEMEEVQTF